MDVEIRHLRAFVAVSEAGTFTAAARRLLITQPALTRIQQLERILGVTLIKRTSRSVELTQAGHTFRDRTQALLCENTAMDETNLQFERLRYLGWPGQAPAYAIGERLWQQLRHDALAQDMSTS